MAKNPAAQALGKLRWKGSTKAERSAAASKAGKARAKSMSAAKRKAIAKKASAAAAAKRTGEAKAKREQLPPAG